MILHEDRFVAIVPTAIPLVGMSPMAVGFPLGLQKSFGHGLGNCVRIFIGDQPEVRIARS